MDEGAAGGAAGGPGIRNAAATRARILQAAQERFARTSYAQAGMREIAAAAGVNVALLARYFGSKEKLFEAALDATIWRDTLWNQPREGFGRRVVHNLVEEAGDGPQTLPMLVNAASDPGARLVALGFIRERVLTPIMDWIGEEEAEARASAILAISAGFHFYRNLLPLPAFSGTMAPAARQWLESAFQAVIDGTMTTGAAEA